jgi:ferredoxin
MPTSPAVRITCLPSGRQADVPAGTNLFTAVRAMGLPVGASCDAEGVCAACGLEVVAGAAGLSRETPFEAELKARNGVPAGQRISCLARVLADVTVQATYW